MLVGLGNPGEEYRRTRHNVGFLVAEEVARRHGAGEPERRARSLVQWARLSGIEVLVARPLTYMNRSGEVVASLLRLGEAEPDDLLVVCDDLHLELGTLRFRPRGSDGGHNGLGSILAALGTQNVPRLRIGIGPPDPDVPHADFVLAPFRSHERRVLAETLDEAADGAVVALQEGIAAAMNRYNSRRRRAGGDGGG